MAEKGKLNYRCHEPPCIHIVVDEERKVFKVFLEDYDRIIPIPIEILVRACTSLKMIGGGEYREADGDEVDFLARKYLNAEPVEEE